MLETGHDVLSYASALTSRMFPLLFEKGSERIETRPRAETSVNESTAHLSALMAGLGIGQTFRFAAQAQLDAGVLVAVLEDWRRDPHPLYVVYPSNRHLNAKLRVFVDWVAGVFASVDARRLAGATPEASETPPGDAIMHVRG